MLNSIDSAVAADELVIPLIDFGIFLHGDKADKKFVACAILDGFQRSGFIYLKNHTIPKQFVSDSFSKSAQFFKRPQDQKDGLAWTSAEANRGYVCQGREKVTDLTDANEILAKRSEEGADLKESLEIGREGVPGQPNRWPDQLDGKGKDFKHHMIEFFDQCKQLHVSIMRAIAVALGLEETWFDKYCDAGDNTLRLLHYPPVSSQVFRKNELQVRAGAHTDYGESDVPCPKPL